MTDQPTFRHHQGPELYVLEALARGAATPDEVAAASGQPADRVAATLDWAVQAQLATRLDPPSGPSYQLTPKGLQTVGMSQTLSGVVDAHGQVDLGGVARLVREQYEAAQDVATEDALREQAGWLADDTARDRVTGALADAYARGALTKEELDDRTGRALSASTMGELRSVATGVVDLPPWLPTAPSAGRVVWNPALAQVRWRQLVWVPFLGLAGLIVLGASSLPGLLLLAVAGGLAVWALWPFLQTAR